MFEDCPKCKKIRELAEYWITPNDFGDEEADRIAIQISKAFGKRLLAILDEQDPLEQVVKNVAKNKDADLCGRLAKGDPDNV